MSVSSGWGEAVHVMITDLPNPLGTPVAVSVAVNDHVRTPLF